MAGGEGDRGERRDTGGLGQRTGGTDSTEEARWRRLSEKRPLSCAKRIKELEQEIEILKRFTAYWVKEGDK